MERSILFFDIDGTILSEKTHEIPPVSYTHLDVYKRQVSKR